MSISLWPHSQVHGTVEEVEELILNFFAQQGWTATADRLNSSDRCVIATTTAPAGLSFGPTEARWHLRSHGDTTAVTFRFYLSRQALMTANALLPAAMVALVTGVFANHPTQIIALCLRIVALLGIVTIAIILLAWMEDKRSSALIKLFCGRAYDETGHPVQLLDQALTKLPSANALIAHATIFLCVAAAMLFHRQFSGIVGTPLLILIAMFGALTLATATAGQFTERLRHCAPYLFGAAMLIVYCSWPIMDSFGEHFAGITGNARLLPLAIFDTGLLLLFWLVARSLGTVGPDTTLMDAEQSPLSHATTTGIVISLWALVAFSQYSGIAWAVARTITRSPIDAATECLWLAPLLAGYIAARKRARASAQRALQHTATIPDSLRKRCEQLAHAIQVRPPRIAMTDGDTTFVLQPLFKRPVLHVSSSVLAALGDQETDALILHELYHVKKHAGMIALLEHLSAAVLCGRGILSIIIDPKKLEHDADRAAAQTLTRLGLPGQQIVCTMLAELEAHQLNVRASGERTGTTNGDGDLTVPRLLQELLWADRPLWYRHPTMQERRAALTEETVCPA